MQNKPVHLTAKYGDQFQDKSIANAYRSRPPYPAEVFAILSSLIANAQLPVLELGAGTGDLTLDMALRVAHLDAVEPSAAMLAQARQKNGSQSANISWHQMAAEEFKPFNRYGLVIAGQSLHWMDWQVVLPMIAHALVGNGFLALVERQTVRQPWEQAVGDLIPQYSTNQDFHSYDLVEELKQRRLFDEVGRQTTEAVPFEQSLEDYIESFHSRNGFSRERMYGQKAAEFDAAVRAAARPYCPDGRVFSEVTGTVIWGRPR